MAKKKQDPPKPSTEPSGQDLRNIRAFEMSASGFTQSEIGEELGITRFQVNRILNSDEAKRLADQARGDLTSLLSEAAQTLSDAMLNRDKDMRTAVNAATTILKGLGVLTEKAEVTVLKPFIMKLLDGSEIHMGHKPDDKKGE